MPDRSRRAEVRSATHHSTSAARSEKIRSPGFTDERSGAMLGDALLALEGALCAAAAVAADEIVKHDAPAQDRALIEIGVKAELWLAVEDAASRFRQESQTIVAAHGQ